VLQTNEDELKKHVLEVKGCEVKEGRPVEGITSDIEKQLKSRKKTHRNQTEAERWQEMYRILFPMEEVPSPCMPKLHSALKIRRQWLTTTKM
jgi:hypothetical protein